MYARDLTSWLHEHLFVKETFQETQRRFETLRGCGLLPRGRENAGVRLSDEQIANAVLSFVHPKPGFAGHASLVLGDLRPVGGAKASFQNKLRLQDVFATLIGLQDANSDLLRVTLSIDQDFNGDDYAATFFFREGTQVRKISYVSKSALTLLKPGAEENYDHERLDKPTAIQRSFGPKFFRDLSRTVSISRELDRPLKTDWQEYATEEEKAKFRHRLGARRSSHFLNLLVEAQVTWPKEPTRIEFGGHHLVLFPKTKNNSHSVSIDLTHERITADDARSLINRLLSVMSWCDDQPASLHEGCSGSPVPVPVPRRNLPFMTAHEWHFYRTPPDDARLQRCLAFYRDGLNALSVGLASHAVLSFFRVIETKYRNGKRELISWINSIFEEIQLIIPQDFRTYELDRQSSGLDHGEYIYKCRVATAHAAHDAPSDPDTTEETRRLLNAAQVIQQLARHFMKLEFTFSDSYLTNEPESVISSLGE